MGLYATVARRLADSCQLPLGVPKAELLGIISFKSLGILIVGGFRVRIHELEIMQSFTQ